VSPGGRLVHDKRVALQQFARQTSPRPAPPALSLVCSQFLFSVSLDPFAAAAAATSISSCEENLQSKLLLIVSIALGIEEQEQEQE